MHWITETVITVAVVLWITNALSLSRRDGTDSKKDRSGLFLYTDHGTGVQYVGTLYGGLSPRLDGNGKPVTVSGWNCGVPK